jgi:uncharacterized membrane protein YbhN (UPF0104 family)
VTGKHLAKVLGIGLFINSLRNHLAELVRDGRRLLTVLGLAGAGRLCDTATLRVSLAAFGHRPGTVGLFVAYGLAGIVGMSPISPGGLGTVEATLIPTPIAFGTPTADNALA